MQRWGIPFHVIETEWTASQFVCLVSAIFENEEQKQGKKKGRISAEEFRQKMMLQQKGIKP